MDQELMFKVPLGYNEFFDVAKDILTEHKIIAVPRAKEFIFYINTEELIKKLDKLLEIEVWTTFERHFLEESKEIFSRAKNKNWIHIKQGNYERYAHLAFTAIIERAHIVKDELVRSTYNEEFNAVKQEFILTFDSIIITIDKIRSMLKDEKFYSEGDIVKTVKKLSTILLNMLYMYGMMIDGNFTIELVRNINKDTNSIFFEYNPVKEIDFLK